MSLNLDGYPPQALLERFKASIPSDPSFRSWCRLKQSVYREKMGWACGLGERKKRQIGNYLTREDAEKGRNFLNERIFAAARFRLVSRERGEVINRYRLFRNMLTSQTLCFNLFIPQVQDNSLATKIWRALLPTKVKQVVTVRLEHSPARGDPAIGLGDHSAFDAYVEYVSLDGSTGKIAIETKYTDSFSPPGSELNDRQQDVLRGSRLYDECGRRNLMAMPTQQLWRTHLLAESLRCKDCPHIMYAVIYAEGDQECSQLLADYEAALNPDIDKNEVFRPCTLEQICRLIEPELTDLDSAWLASFRERYLDWSDVEFHL